MSDTAAEFGALTARQRDLLRRVLDGGRFQRGAAGYSRASQSGKRWAMLEAIAEAVARGEVVHVAARGRLSCTQAGHCKLPAWNREG